MRGSSSICLLVPTTALKPASMIERSSMARLAHGKYSRNDTEASSRFSSIGIMVVTPPMAALRVSVETLTSNGSWKVWRCTCGSMIPGSTCSPSASITRLALGNEPWSPMAAILPSLAATSARTMPSGKTTLPPLITRS
jgi:hypothetical protein